LPKQIFSISEPASLVLVFQPPWKDANSDTPILKQAKAEYAKLQ
jgi:hypothetical protein